MSITTKKLEEFIADRIRYHSGDLDNNRSGINDPENRKYKDSIDAALKKSPMFQVDLKDRPNDNYGVVAEATGGIKFVDDKGIEHKAYMPNEKLAGPLTEGLREDSFGRILRANILGNREGLTYEEKTLSEGTGSTGGFFISDVVASRVWDEARNQSVIFKAGALTFPMSGPIVRLVKITGSPDAYFVAENEAITEGNFVIAPVTLKAMTVGCYVKSSLELLQDAPNAAAAIQNSMAKSIALKIDLSGLAGDGVSAPRGIANMDGRNIISMGTNGATLTNYDEFSEGVQDVLEANGNPNACIFSPRTYGTLDRLKTNTTLNPLTPPKSFQDLKKFVTNQVGIEDIKGTCTSASKAYIGDFRQMLVGVRSGLSIEVAKSGDSTFAKNQLRIRVTSRIDIAIMNEAFFTTIEGIKV